MFHRLNFRVEGLSGTVNALAGNVQCAEFSRLCGVGFLGCELLLIQKTRRGSYCS